ncbi:hypothetical protein BAUCODRAFT_30850 [Baudoinia panamericana UAMH 10762]|uniref:Uncharacterized protein n=1 Tax=Baudoinia panamericana (strain UAMH 10762) TaxID=717646 RepID=M2NHQ7_BAUPA|nr:uncharacterized protein BAUCODRAFT_30850 [Baudoinia panamericana UAMH 10762]EMC98580.1 hypothetical protein BAUCODRAFT_30850 [Baudoinia panamericana UAMH 10762]
MTRLSNEARFWNCSLTCGPRVVGSISRTAAANRRGFVSDQRTVIGTRAIVLSCRAFGLAVLELCLMGEQTK